MEWVQTVSIISSVIISAYYLHRDIREDIKTQSDRTDKLYDIFLKNQEEFNNRFYKLQEDTSNKFYEMLKKKDKK